MAQQVKSQSSSNYNGWDPDLVDTFPSRQTIETVTTLGTFSVVDLNGDTELRCTCTSPGTAEYYRNTGKLAGGIVLEKEVFATDHAQMAKGAHIGLQERKCGSR